MNEEEKQAINFMRNEIIDFEKRFGTEITTETNRNYEIILNLIETQQDEIMKLKILNDKQADIIDLLNKKENLLLDRLLERK